MNREPTEFLTVSGVLTPELQLSLRPSFVTPPLQLSPAPVEISATDAPAVDIHLLDTNQEVVGRQALEVVPICIPGRGDTGWVVSGRIPYPRSTRTVRYLSGGTVLVEIDVPSRGPRVGLAWQPEPEVRGVQAIRWRSSQDVGAPSHVVLYSWNDGRDWLPVSLPTDQSHSTVDFDELPGGDQCLIRILASSGVATTVQTSPRFSVARKGVRPLIVAPGDGDVVPAAAVVLAGQAYDLDQRRFVTEGLTWTSDLKGDLGQGPVVLVSLPPGRQVLTLTEASSQASTAITIDADPAQAPLQLGAVEEPPLGGPSFPA